MRSVKWKRNGKWLPDPQNVQRDKNACETYMEQWNTHIWKRRKQNEILTHVAFIWNFVNSFINRNRSAWSYTFTQYMRYTMHQKVKPKPCKYLVYTINSSDALCTMHCNIRVHTMLIMMICANICFQFYCDLAYFPGHQNFFFQHTQLVAQ